jgi:hypothetical protein
MSNEEIPYHKKPVFRDSIVLLFKLHKLMEKNGDEGEEGEKIREEMDVLWRQLTEDEISKLRDFSCFLYIVQEDYEITEDK